MPSTKHADYHSARIPLQGPLSVVAHNRKVVGALSVVGATESQIFNNFLEFFQNISKIYGFLLIIYNLLKFRQNFVKFWTETSRFEFIFSKFHEDHRNFAIFSKDHENFVKY